MKPTPEEEVRHALSRLLGIDGLPCLDRVSRETGQSREAILGRSHEPAPTRARYAFWTLLSDARSLSDSALGRLVGRHHTTIAYGLRQHAERVRGEEK